jgi:hypothetical protein
LYFNFTKRMRDEIGVKFSVSFTSTQLWYEGVVSVEITQALKWVLGWWCFGRMCNQQIIDNKQYNGEYTVNVTYTQTELKCMLQENSIPCGGDSVRVLEDINCLVTTMW